VVTVGGAERGPVDEFEQHRAMLRGVAYRMLGSVSDAEDAVQEAWLRLARTEGVVNEGGWLRTVVSRICLDMLRARREEPAGDRIGEDEPAPDDPAAESVLVDEVGRALLVVLDQLGPDERVAFVLHDLFAVPFEEVGPVVGRSAGTAKKLASRARLKVRGTPAVSGAELARQRKVVEAFLAAARAGDVDAVLAVLAPDVVRRGDVPGRPKTVRGARNVVDEIVAFGQSAVFGAVALVDGNAGIVVAPHGRLALALRVVVVDALVAEYVLVTDAEVAVLDM
jgi:RNA polymerase sigma-70 factor, ECF subfamily